MNAPVTAADATVVTMMAARVAALEQRAVWAERAAAEAGKKLETVRGVVAGLRAKVDAAGECLFVGCFDKCLAPLPRGRFMVDHAGRVLMRLAAPTANYLVGD